MANYMFVFNHYWAVLIDVCNKLFMMHFLSYWKQFWKWWWIQHYTSSASLVTSELTYAIISVTNFITPFWYLEFLNFYKVDFVERNEVFKAFV